ncbi:MAG: ATP synthase F0 subunit C [Deltaproteobacteria bacterium]|nr:ATP synthase F0 subunit C [Deltaproteobacteria bacterium]
MVKKAVRIFSLILVLSCLFGSLAFAAEKEPLSQDVKKFIGLACGFGIAIAAFGGALAQGRAIASGLEGIARNPEAQPRIFIPMIVGLALIESLVIYVLVVTFILIGKL